jgi:hypothetical protein
MLTSVMVVRGGTVKSPTRHDSSANTSLGWHEGGSIGEYSGENPRVLTSSMAEPRRCIGPSLHYWTKALPAGAGIFIRRAQAATAACPTVRFSWLDSAMGMPSS